MGTKYYRGRFAPSPTGPLHAGSLVAALASWLDAQAHDGVWLVRIEDVDRPRTVAGATEHILQQLRNCGLVPDAPVARQSGRSALYDAALDKLKAQHRAYPCTCSRKDILEALQQAGVARERHGELVYPGTCRPAVDGTTQKPADSAWRFVVDPSRTAAHSATPTAIYSDTVVQWTDDRLGPQQQDVAKEVGDFVLRRADACYTYQLAVVVDDAAQGITHVVRGADLLDNTARQISLQRALGLATPRYLHTPLVMGANGEKLSKQNDAQQVDTFTPEQALAALCQAAQVLDLEPGQHVSIATALNSWVTQWRERYRATAARMDRAT